MKLQKGSRGIAIYSFSNLGARCVVDAISTPL